MAIPRACRSLALLAALAGSATADGPVDRFGVRHMQATAAGGHTWTADWGDGNARTFTGQDPRDRWFDADHGEGRYQVDGLGALTAAGDYVRMYVHDPACRREWSENLEITVYVARIGETKVVGYSGVQIFARTNHGTVGNENRNYCDDRGYGAKVTLDGRFEFEKEVRHHADHGYVGAATVRPWSELPKDRAVGVKYVLRNQQRDSQVRLELYRDLTGGAGGGTWQKLTEFVDTGANWGHQATPPKPGVAPELPLIRRLVLPDSESGRPQLTVYFRHEFGTMRYEKASIREIEPLP